MKSRLSVGVIVTLAMLLWTHSGFAFDLLSAGYVESECCTVDEDLRIRELYKPSQYSGVGLIYRDSALLAGLDRHGLPKITAANPESDKPCTVGNDCFQKDLHEARAHLLFKPAFAQSTVFILPIKADSPSLYVITTGHGSPLADPECWGDDVQDATLCFQSVHFLFGFDGHSGAYRVAGDKARRAYCPRSVAEPGVRAQINPDFCVVEFDRQDFPKLARKTRLRYRIDRTTEIHAKSVLLSAGHPYGITQVKTKSNSTGHNPFPESKGKHVFGAAITAVVGQSGGPIFEKLNGELLLRGLISKAGLPGDVLCFCCSKNDERKCSSLPAYDPPTGNDQRCKEGGTHVRIESVLEFIKQKTGKADDEI